MPLTSRSRRIPHRLISFFLCFLNVMLIMLTLGSHGWTMHFPDTDIHSAGLWVICSRRYGCQNMKSANVYLNTIRISMITALLTAVIAMLWTVEWDHIVHCKFIFLPKSLMTAILNFIAGFCVLLAALVFESRFNQKAVEPERKWAFYLSYIISMLCFLSGGYNVLNYKWALWGTRIPAVEKTEEVHEREPEVAPTSL